MPAGGEVVFKTGEFLRIRLARIVKAIGFHQELQVKVTARMVEAGPNGTSVFTAVTPDGTNVWTMNGDGSNVRAFALNRFLTEIADAEFRVINYRGADGGPLKAHLLLPAGYRDNTRLPVVVWVYPGTSLYDDRTRRDFSRKTPRHPSGACCFLPREGMPYWFRVCRWGRKVNRRIR